MICHGKGTPFRFRQGEKCSSGRRANNQNGHEPDRGLYRRYSPLGRIKKGILQQKVLYGVSGKATAWSPPILTRLGVRRRAQTARRLQPSRA